jgi:hypothetical protein
MLLLHLFLFLSQPRVIFRSKSVQDVRSTRIAVLAVDSHPIGFCPLRRDQPRPYKAIGSTTSLMDICLFSGAAALECLAPHHFSGFTRRIGREAFRIRQDSAASITNTTTTTNHHI